MSISKFQDNIGLSEIGLAVLVLFLAHTQIELVIESKLANSSKNIGEDLESICQSGWAHFMYFIMHELLHVYSLLLLLLFFCCCCCLTENKLVTATYHYYYCFYIIFFIRCCAPAIENFNYEPIDFISVWFTSLVDVLQVFPFLKCEISAHKTCKHILCSAFFKKYLYTCSFLFYYKTRFHVIQSIRFTLYSIGIIYMYNVCYYYYSY